MTSLNSNEITDFLGSVYSQKPDSLCIFQMKPEVAIALVFLGLCKYIFVVGLICFV